MSQRTTGSVGEQREGFTLGQFLLLVDYTSRVVRQGRSWVSKELASIIERLGSSAEIWSKRTVKLNGARLIGRFLSASRDRLRDGVESETK